MKFRVERDVLAEAVAWAARSLPARPPVPVLAGLMLDAREGAAGLVLSSFDYEVSARVEIAADISEPGVALVSGRLLADISRSLPDRPVEVTTDASKVVLTCGSSRFTLLTLPVEDYPALPEMPGAYGTAGWTRDGQSLLVYDRYDLWQLFPDGRPARNLFIGRRAGAAT